MSPAQPTRRAAGRSLLPYAAISAVPVLLLGAALAFGYSAQARARGLNQGRAEAVLIAKTAVAPALGSSPLGSNIAAAERDRLQSTVSKALAGGEILRLRLRNLSGQVVYSDDGSGFAARPEDEAIDAAHGAVVAKLTRLNKDVNDVGAAGVAAVEVYQPLMAGPLNTRVGVLELYLPYGPINADIAAGMRSMYIDLSIGLIGLYLVLLAISVSVTRGLRRQAALNAFLAGHDTLTGMANRVGFHRAGDKALARRRADEAVVVAIIDLDRFQAVNDAMGHHNGDIVLRAVAGRLSASVTGRDTVARLGGDEFGVILVDAPDAAEALGRIRAAIEDEIEVDGVPLSVESRVGYVVAPADGTDFDELLQRADIAVRHAKDHHLGVTRYRDSQSHYDAASLALVAELRRAISEGQLLLHYQPKTRLAGGAVEAVEALVRWQHPLHGLLFPDRFIPLVEQTDLIDELTRWVVRRALADLACLPEPMVVSVNASARNLANPAFADEICAAVRSAQVEPARLMVELTETALLVDPARAAEVLGDLARLGIRASVDDFGRGHTSLGYLSELPLAEMKIDRSFVSDMIENPAHAAIVASVVELGHNLGIIVVAEGVETTDAAEVLTRIGCDVAQGYLFARPMPLEALQAWLTATGPTVPVSG